MRQAKGEQFRKKAGALIGTLAVLALIAGCSGGGSIAPPTLNYTGATTPVAITEDNAEAVLFGAYEGGLLGSVFNVLGAARAESTSQAINMPRIHDLAAVLESFLHDIDLQSQQPGMPAGALISHSDTLFGSCGGAVYYNVDLDSIFGDFSGTADFRDYCDVSNPDLMLDGVTDFSGDFEVFSLEIDDFSFVYRDLKVNSNTGDYILNGSMSGSASMTWAAIYTSSVLQDVLTAKTYWLKDFVINTVQGNGFIDIALTGRYYDHDYGYVDVRTEEPIRVYDNADWPASGILAGEGAAGEQGGNTMARLIVLDTDFYQIEADTDGDGSFDDYASGPLRWTDI